MRGFVSTPPRPQEAPPAAKPSVAKRAAFWVAVAATAVTPSVKCESAGTGSTPFFIPARDCAPAKKISRRKGSGGKTLRFSWEMSGQVEIPLEDGSDSAGGTR